MSAYQPPKRPGSNFCALIIALVLLFQFSTTNASKLVCNASTAICPGDMHAQSVAQWQQQHAHALPHGADVSEAACCMRARAGEGAVVLQLLQIITGQFMNYTHWCMVHSQ